jgi:hypothetical protein
MTEEGFDGIEGDVSREDKKANTYEIEGNPLAALVVNGRG